MTTRLAVAAITVSTLLGCATAKLGDKSAEADLKRFEVATGRVSLYVCREDTMNGGGIGTEAFVNGRSVGALKPNTFAHTLVEPGDVQIFLRRNGLNHNSGDSGTLKLKTVSGQVLVVWAGPAGFMGPLTVDNFSSEADGRACVQKATYAIP